MINEAKVDSRNRLCALLFALLLVAASVLGLLAAFGGFGDRTAQDPPVSSAVTDFVGRNEWAWYALGGLGLLLVVLGLLWLRGQLHTEAVRTLDLERDDRQGATVLHTGALAHAVENDVQAIRGVRKASASMLGVDRRTRLRLVVDLDERADLALVRQRIEDDAVRNLRRALETENFPVEVRLELAKRNRGALL